MQQSIMYGRLLISVLANSCKLVPCSPIFSFARVSIHFSNGVDGLPDWKKAGVESTRGVAVSFDVGVACEVAGSSGVVSFLFAAIMAATSGDMFAMFRARSTLARCSGV